MAIERIVTPKLGQNNKVLLVAKDVEIGSGKIDDVKVDGVSVVTNKVANISLASKQNNVGLSIDSQGRVCITYMQED